MSGFCFDKEILFPIARLHIIIESCAKFIDGIFHVGVQLILFFRLGIEQLFDSIVRNYLLRVIILVDHHIYLMNYEPGKDL